MIEFSALLNFLCLTLMVTVYDFDDYNGRKNELILLNVLYLKFKKI